MTAQNRAVERKLKFKLDKDGSEDILPSSFLGSYQEGDIFMLDRIALPNFRETILKIFGVPPPQLLQSLDERLEDLEKSISAWAKKAERVASRQRVLLADTETVSFDTLRKVLPEDFELKMVKDWDQLFRETKKAQVPLVVIDLALLGQEGVHNIRKLKEEQAQIRIVALANYLSEAFAQAMPEGLELAGILQKPLDEALLSENLRKYLS